ncbi:SIR2 family protein, partial [Escherichia coli]
HYVFKKRHKLDEVRKHISELGIKEKDNEYTKIFIKTAEKFEEQDANNLGLNVIWVNDFQEIPPLLRQLTED